MFTIFLGLTPFIFITFLGFIFGKLKVLDLSHAKILNLPNKKPTKVIKIKGVNPKKIVNMLLLNSNSMHYPTSFKGCSLVQHRSIIPYG